MHRYRYPSTAYHASDASYTVNYHTWVAASHSHAALYARTKFPNYRGELLEVEIDGRWIYVIDAELIRTSL
jgi:hypothetical protein